MEHAWPCSDLLGTPEQWGDLVNSEFIWNLEREAGIKSEVVERSFGKN